MSFAVAVEIGDGDSVGCDLFYMSICNPAFLSKAADQEDWVWQNQMLVLATLSLENVRHAVERKILSEGPFQSWPEFARKMAPFMRWEFSDQNYPPNHS